NGEVVESVRRNGSSTATVGGSHSIFGALPGEDPLQTHEAGNAIASSRTTQRMRQSWAAVSLATASKFLSDPLAQADVFQLARSGVAAPLFPVVVTAARDQKRLASTGDLVLAAHALASSIPLGGARERRPRHLFKTAR